MHVKKASRTQRRRNRHHHHHHGGASNKYVRGGVGSASSSAATDTGNHRQSIKLKLHKATGKTEEAQRDAEYEATVLSRCALCSRYFGTRASSYCPFKRTWFEHRYHKECLIAHACKMTKEHPFGSANPQSLFNFELPDENGRCNLEYMFIIPLNRIEHMKDADQVNLLTEVTPACALSALKPDVEIVALAHDLATTFARTVDAGERDAPIPSEVLKQVAQKLLKLLKRLRFRTAASPDAEKYQDDLRAYVGPNSSGTHYDELPNIIDGNLNGRAIAIGNNVYTAKQKVMRELLSIRAVLDKQFTNTNVANRPGVGNMLKMMLPSLKQATEVMYALFRFNAGA